MTKEELKQVIHICGINFEKNDIPAFIRKRDMDEDRAEELAKQEAELEAEEIVEEWPDNIEERLEGLK